MNNKSIALTLLAGTLVIGQGSHSLAENSKPSHELKLSADTLSLLRAEMREISGGIQFISLSLATADWHGIQETGEKIRASYILEKKLTQAQANELAQALPERFKQLDAEFHERAKKLSIAAASRDAEQVAFHYSRLLEGCVACHSVYAQKRFPGFTTTAPQEHHHH